MDRRPPLRNPILREPLLNRIETNKRLKIAHSPSMRSLHQRPETDFLPQTWTDFFIRQEYIETPQGIFCAYFAGSDINSPVILCLHGAGFSALTWAVFAQEITRKARVRVIAIDLRGHGDTHTELEEDLSMDNLVNDVCQCVLKLFKHERVVPNIILLGHSLGGAVATCAASNPRIGGLIQALIVLDVVEGSALESLSHMTNVLRTRPKGFETMKDAIFWSCTKAQTDDFTAIRVSVPGQLKHIETGEPAKHFVRKENEYWRELVASRSTIGNLRLDSGESSSSGLGRNHFQPVVPPPSEPDITHYRSSSTRDSAVIPAVHRGLPAVGPTYESTNHMFRTPRDVRTPLRTTPMRSRNPNFVGENEGQDVSTPRLNSSTRTPHTMNAPTASQPMLPAQSDELGATSAPVAQAQALPNYAANLSSRSSLPAIPQGNVLRFPWTGRHEPPSNKPHEFAWRVNLFNTELYWQDWFTGMSDKFLECPAKKLLVLCGTDRLDTKLLRGQMQGKFQTSYIKCGHQIQEDNPQELCNQVTQFLVRHKLVEPMDCIRPAVFSTPTIRPAVFRYNATD